MCTTALVVLQMDRFIPSRSATDLDAASYALLKEGGKDGTDAENTPPNKVCCAAVCCPCLCICLLL